jgi:hypothetical protein
MFLPRQNASLKLTISQYPALARVLQQTQTSGSYLNVGSPTSERREGRAAEISM